MTTVQARLVDLHQRRIYPAEICVKQGYISSIRELDSVPEENGFILPGFIDAHVHVESSMLPPTEFARMAVVHGTVATISDPHEIANVLGEEGVLFMLEDAARTPLKICFGAPSCVPATTFETAGAVLDADAVERLLQRADIGYLSEMMNFPGVLHNDPEVMKKIAAAQRIGKPVDGHAPGLKGEMAEQYFKAGISTDHECFTLDEAEGKAALGVHILIREGSAARNFEALWPMINEYPRQVMFCSDDKHPDELAQGHINRLVARAVEKGCDLFDVLRAACVHPVEHYHLKVGLLREGDPADFVIVSDLTHFEVRSTWIDGQQVAGDGQTFLPKLSCETPNQFVALRKKSSDFQYFTSKKETSVQVIEVFDGEIVTGKSVQALDVSPDGEVLPDLESDVLMITVVNRYAPTSKPALGFVRGFGLRQGALASSVAHDSHNIVAVGVSAAAIAAAVNAVIDAGGGICACTHDAQVQVLPLPIAGLMSIEDGWTLAKQYAQVDAWTKSTLGCRLKAPFMSLSFLALPVIPDLKMTDLGLFDVGAFDFAPVEV
ncbi:MAG: adenine deaminase [Saprospiraceae bacterium]|nr:adenine deaminase [Saprospiraceae bacterium]